MSAEFHPVQPGEFVRNPWLPKEVTLRAYEVYSHVYAPQEAMITGGCRGGFSVGELLGFLYARSFPKDEWQQRVDEAFKRKGAHIAAGKMSMNAETARQLDFLARMPGGHTTMSKEDAKQMLLDTGGQMMACGTLYEFALKDLGADVYRVTLTLAYKGAV